MLTFFLTILESDEDRRRFTTIYEQYHIRLESIAVGILADQKDAEDAVQNAFIQVIRHFEKIDKISCEELPFWLISIVKNEALLILRKKKRTILEENLERFDAAVDNIAGYEELVELFAHLPDTYRMVLEMKYLFGYSDKEIAKRLGISETAVSTRASRGRSLLRKIAEREGFY